MKLSQVIQKIENAGFFKIVGKGIVTTVKGLWNGLLHKYHKIIIGIAIGYTDYIWYHISLDTTKALQIMFGLIAIWLVLSDAAHIEYVRWRSIAKKDIDNLFNFNKPEIPEAVSDGAIPNPDRQ